MVLCFCLSMELPFLCTWVISSVEELEWAVSLKTGWEHVPCDVSCFRSRVKSFDPEHWIGHDALDLSFFIIGIQVVQSPDLETIKLSLVDHLETSSRSLFGKEGRANPQR